MEIYQEYLFLGAVSLSLFCLLTLKSDAKLGGRQNICGNLIIDLIMLYVNCLGSRIPFRFKVTKAKS
jgi:hypothetical protein